MAITFIQKRKIKQPLILVFIGLFLITIILWQVFLKKERISIPEDSKLSEVKINFKVLKNPIFQDLQLFKKIVPFEEDVGRENPFIPYE